MAIEAKVCCKCGIEKPITDYCKKKRGKFGVNSICKACQKEYRHQYYQKNKEIELPRSRSYQDSHPEYWEYRKEYEKKYRTLNVDTIKDFQKEYYRNNKDRILEYQNEYYLRNKTDIYNKNYERHKERLKSDRVYKMTRLMRHRLWSALKYQSAKKRKSVKNLVGVEGEILKLLLQAKAVIAGYERFNICNYSGEDYHIDHVIPCTAFNLNCSYHQQLCFHHSNLQILPAEENIRKGNRI